GHFFSTTVMISDNRINFLHVLTVKSEYNAQYSVGTGVVAAQVEDHQVFAVFAFSANGRIAPGKGLVALVFLKVLRANNQRFHLGRAVRMLFPKGVPLPPIRHQDSTHVWMTVKLDPEHIVN